MSDNPIKAVCVFCGSRVGSDGQHAKAARALGRTLAERGLELVYGGGQVGLMGVIADTVLKAGGRVLGVIPQPLATKELLHPKATVMHVVPGMHARKAKMAELADAFIAMPGGYGTLEELLEVITWSQLGLHNKPVGVLNVAGYYDPLVELVDRGVEQNFIKEKNRKLLVVEDEPEALLERLIHHHPPEASRRWIKPGES